MYTNVTCLLSFTHNLSLICIADNEKNLLYALKYRNGFFSDQTCREPLDYIRQVRTAGLYSASEQPSLLLPSHLLNR